MATVSVRYIVNDVDEAIDFYCRHLGFHEEMHPAPTFAMLSRGDLRLVLSARPAAPGAGVRQRPTAPCPSQAVGTVSPSRSQTSMLSSRICETVALTSATTLSTVSEASKSSLTTPLNAVELFEPTLEEARLERPS